MKIGVFGGTFDPPHLGHLILAEEARVQLNLDRVLWVLTPLPPHKPDQLFAPLADRIDMVLAAIQGNPYFELSRVDFDRPPPTYAVDTISLLREQYPGFEFSYLMGEDSFRDLLTWHKPLDFIHKCDQLGVMRRLGGKIELFDLESKLTGITEKTHFFDIPLIDISASQIRNRVKYSLSFRYYVTEIIYELITRRGLYKGKTA